MRFKLTSLAVALAGGATLALAFGGVANAGHYGFHPAARLAVPHTYAQHGHWAAGNGQGGLGHHWASNGARLGAFALGYGAGTGYRQHHHHAGGYYGAGYYGESAGYYGGAGAYYNDTGSYDTTYRPSAYTAVNGYDYGYGYAAAQSYYAQPQSYERSYVVPTTVYQPTVRTSYVPVTSYRAVQHIQYIPTTQYRTVRKRCHCEWE